MLSMHESRGSDEAHQLGAEYGLGEYIREYKVKQPTLSSLFAMTVALILLITFMTFISLIANGFAHGFQFDLRVLLIIFGLFVTVSAILSLLFSIPTWRARNAVVYIFSNGFIMRDRKQTRAVRWYEVERVDTDENDTSCVVYLADKTSLKPDQHIAELKMLAMELKLKVQLGTHPERSLEIERQVEQFQNDPPWLQQARKQGNLFKEKEQFLKKNEPEEVYQLGEEYQLGNVLLTSRARLQSLLLPNKMTFIEYIILLFIIGLFLLLFTVSSFGWYFLLLLFFPLQFILFRLSAHQSRFHLYEGGLIYVRTGSLDVIRWEQIEKTLYVHTYEFFKSHRAIYLRDGSKIEISDYLDKQEDVKLILNTKTLLEETYPDKKKQNKDGYRDIGHLAD